MEEIFTFKLFEQELLGRPIRLKFSEKYTEESDNEKEEEADEIVHVQPQDS